MKNSLLTLGLIMSLTFDASAQSILNGSFEDWTTTQFDDLSSWNNSNRETMREGIISVSKVPGVSGSAVKLETLITPMGDTVGGFIANTDGDPTEGQGGVPFSQLPTAFTGKYKANMVGNDSAILLVIFKKNGASIGTMFFTLGGKNQTTFSTFNFPITLSQTPDSVVIASASSNLLSEIGVEAGSTITYDDFAFTGPGVTQTIPNGNFDTWTVLTADKINGWDAQGPPQSIEKTSDSYKGNSAIKLSTVIGEGGRVDGAYLTNGRFPQQSGNMIGRPFTNQNDTLIGYYKFSSPGQDSAFISLQVTKNGTTVGGGFTALTAKSGYTEFRIPISCMDVPDSMNLFISMSGMSSQPAPGCVLILDEVQLASAPLHTGLLMLSSKTTDFTLYPNPVTNMLFINDTELGTTISIYDIAGKLQLEKTQTDKDGVWALNLEQLSSGLYHCVMMNKSGAFSQQKFVKQ